MNHILCGDALEQLRLLPSESVHVCVTSPPYYGLRDYGVPGQLGCEQVPNVYVKKLVAVFDEVKRVLVPEGTLWLNISDSYAGSSKGAWHKPVSKRPKNKQIYHYRSEEPGATMPKHWQGIKPKDMIGIPWMLAFALRDSGWYLRSDVIWQKPNCMPHPVKDRPVSSYEHIFLLAKSHKYYFDYSALEVPIAPSSRTRYMRNSVSKRYENENSAVPGQAKQPITLPRKGKKPPDKRRGRDVWTFGTNSFRVSHFAAYPPELVRPCILAGCPENGTVLDPFLGSGTTGAVAKELGRQFIGIDLNADYCAMSRARIDAVQPRSKAFLDGEIRRNPDGSKNQ